MTDTGDVLLCVHGRGRKPAAPVLAALWEQALRRGVERDHPDALGAFERLQVEHVWFGDLNAGLLDAERPRVWDEALDVADLQAALAALAARDKAKRFRRQHYEELPGKNALKEFAADLTAGVGGRLGLGKLFWRRAAPEVAAMLDAGEYRDALVARVAERVDSLLAPGRRLLVVSHCVGAVAVWHALAGLGSPPERVHTWLTLGAPLADDTVRRSLPGTGGRSGAWPESLLNWVNVAAEDDYLCHDETVANDFAPMLQQRHLSRLEDQRIYNLAVRFGRSNPHCVLGYLVHPRVADVLAAFSQEA